MKLLFVFIFFFGCSKAQISSSTNFNNNDVMEIEDSDIFTPITLDPNPNSQPDPT